MQFACAGSHPFAQYADSVIYPADRYRLLMERNQWAARRIMTFALHLHLGARDGDHAVALINFLMPYMAHFLALSASSPFWQGEDTGLASSRITVFEALPTAGHPPTYTSWKEFETLYDSLVTSGSISSVKDLWWDIRPRPEYGTVEMRICDGVPTLSETIALVVLFEALTRRLDEEYSAGARPAPPPTGWSGRTSGAPPATAWRPTSSWTGGTHRPAAERGPEADRVAPAGGGPAGDGALLRRPRADGGAGLLLRAPAPRLPEGGIAQGRRRGPGGGVPDQPPGLLRRALPTFARRALAS